MTVSLRALARSRATAVLVVAASVSLVGSPAGAAPTGADELEAARRRADGVAGELAESQSSLARLEVEVADLEREQAETEVRLQSLRTKVRVLAVERFVEGATPVAPVQFGSDLGRGARAGALARVVTARNDEVVDEFRVTTEDLAVVRDGLDRTRAETRAAVDTLEERSAEAMAELERLERLERLEAERRAREERERRAREEAARRAQAERAARVADAARAAQEQAAAATARSSSTSAAGKQGSAGTAPAAPGTTARTAPSAVPPAAPATRAPRTPRAPVAQASAPSTGGGWLCPVQGARAYTNDWGMPRSGGRRHQGTDILSPMGTPVVASVSGSVRGHNSSLGGTSYYLTGDDGTTYYGTHLESLSGASGHVSAGTVLGYVGNSGNARGGPTHLHFEIHPGGGAPTNPYPTLRSHC